MSICGMFPVTKIALSLKHGHSRIGVLLLGLESLDEVWDVSLESWAEGLEFPGYRVGKPRMVRAFQTTNEVLSAGRYSAEGRSKCHRQT